MGRGPGEPPLSSVKALSEAALKPGARARQPATDDLLLMAACPADTPRSCSAAAARDRDERKPAEPEQYQFLWVTDFPLLEYSSEDGRWYWMHYPFILPHDEDFDKLDPARREHYSRMLGEAQRQMAETRTFNDQREDGQRDDNGNSNNNSGNGNGGGGNGYDGQRRQQPMAPQMGSGLAMIDPEDAYDMDGPIETPEGRRPHNEPAPVVVPVIEEARAPAPEPAPVAADPFNGVEQMPSAEPAPIAAPEAEAAEAPAPAAKRPRTRRRHKPEATEAGAAEPATPEEAKQPS